ncbi:MAG TPA: ribbon-helix-helix protein, CopG family [Methanocorpusculum sp.]|nr:ribbon-helix-helix protein, CopG family [Methanocorpusculum sp.]
MRITENHPDTPINVKVPSKLKTRIDELADEMQISTASFVRKALEEKVARMDSCADAGSMSPDELKDVIREVVNEMLEEKKRQL